MKSAELYWLAVAAENALVCPKIRWDCKGVCSNVLSWYYFGYFLMGQVKSDGVKIHSK